MAALLRSGKVLRNLAGLTRQQITQPTPPQPTLSGPATTTVQEGSSSSTAIAIPVGGFDGQSGSSFQAWSLQHLQGALPAISSATCVASSDRDKDDKDPLLEFLNDATTNNNDLQVQEESASQPKEIEQTECKALTDESKEPSSKIEGESGCQESSLFKNQKLQPNTPVAEEQSRQLTTEITSSSAEPIKEDDLKSDSENIVIKQDSVTHPSKDQTGEESSDKERYLLPTVQHVVPVVPLFDANPEHTQWYPLPVVCEMFRQQGRYWDLECLLEGSHGIRPEDRKMIYFWTLQTYADIGLFDRAVALSGRLHLEGLGQQFPEYHQLMSSFAAVHSSFAPTMPYSSYAVSGIQSSSGDTSISTPAISGTTTPALSLDGESFQNPMPVPPSSFSSDASRNRRANSKVQLVQRRFKKALSEEDVSECQNTFRELKDSSFKSLSITELSTFIELLLKEDKVGDATLLAEKMLSSDIYPMPKIFRFLLNKLASSGDVSAMTNLGQHLTSKVKKEVSYDNRLCNAYLASGRGAEYLDILVGELNNVIDSKDFSDERVQSLKDKFPRGGAMGLLESNPELVDKYTDLSHKFLMLGYVAPMNVLWTYHFIGERHEVAMTLWDKHVKTCPQIMFQKVCQTARATSNADLAQRLVNLLENAETVTVGARGIAYSCLLDVLTQRKEFPRGVKALKEGLKSGISIDDINRTALKRLKEGLEATTDEVFPFEIPKKVNFQHKLQENAVDIAACDPAIDTSIAKL